MHCTHTRTYTRWWSLCGSMVLWFSVCSVSHLLACHVLAGVHPATSNILVFICDVCALTEWVHTVQHSVCEYICACNVYCVQLMVLIKVQHTSCISQKQINTHTSHTRSNSRAIASSPAMNHAACCINRRHDIPFADASNAKSKRTDF